MSCTCVVKIVEKQPNSAQNQCPLMMISREHAYKIKIFRKKDFKKMTFYRLTHGNTLKHSV